MSPIAPPLSLRDVVDPGGEWRALRIEVRSDPAARRPPTRVEITAPRGFRVVVANAPALSVRVDDDFHGYEWRRSDVPRSALPPLRVADARAHGATGGSSWHAKWARTFGALLAASDVSPFHPGPWEIRPWTASFDGAYARDARTMLERTIADREDGHTEWDIGDLLPPLLLRPPSAPDHGRVKALRKLARAGCLPPLLLWWIAGLDRFVVLDGADRLLASLLEGRTPEALALTALREERRSGAGDLRQAADAAALRVAGRPLDGRAMDSLNALLVAAYDERPRMRAVTRAWPATGTR